MNSVGFIRNFDVLSENLRWELANSKIPSTSTRSTHFIFPIHIFSTSENRSHLHKIIRYTSDIDARSSSGETALRMATVGGCVKGMRCLIDKGANPNFAMDVALGRRDESAIAALLKSNVECEFTADMHRTASSLPKNILHTIVKYLIEVGKMTDAIADIYISRHTHDLEEIETLFNFGIVDLPIGVSPFQATIGYIAARHIPRNSGIRVPDIILRRVLDAKDLMMYRLVVSMRPPDVLIATLHLMCDINYEIFEYIAHTDINVLRDHLRDHGYYIRSSLQRAGPYKKYDNDFSDRLVWLLRVTSAFPPRFHGVALTPFEVPTLFDLVLFEIAKRKTQRESVDLNLRIAHLRETGQWRLIFEN